MTTITCRKKMSSSPILSRRQLVLFEVVLCIVTSSNVKEDGNRRQGCTAYIMAREAPTTPNGKPGAPTLILTQAFPSSLADRLCWASPPTVVSANLTSCAIHGLLLPLIGNFDQCPRALSVMSFPQQSRQGMPLISGKDECFES